MSSGIASLNKILKDETRTKIVLLLNEKGSLSYTELMERLGFVTTGLFNYHLKVLGDLLVKNDSGQYTLSDKGKLAARLLTEFPNTQQSGVKPKWWRKFWIQTAIALPIMLTIALALYFLGFSNLQGLYEGLLSIVFIIGFAYMIQHILRDVISKRAKLLVAKAVYIAGGVEAGLCLAYFVVGIILSGVSRLMGNGFEPGNLLYNLFWSVWYQIFGLLIAPIIGAFLIYHYGKNRRFKTPNYNPDL
jgi:hypothetical protein